MKKVYFPNLNGLRFIAAAMVLYPHIEQIKGSLGLEHSFKYFPVECGKLGVVFFFVLSGFLITYLLLVEKDKYKTIFVFDFYKRRMLRIWPLYYLLVLLGFFVFSYIPFLTDAGPNSSSYSINNFLLFIFFLPNFAGIVPLISHLWSVGVEEQFYLIWPVLIKYVKNKYVLLFSVIVIYFIVLFIVKLYFNQWLFNIITWAKIDCMAIGGIFALLLFEKRRILKILYYKELQILTYSLLLLLLLSKIFIPYFHFEVFSILFGIIILNMSSNNKTIFSIENKMFNYLGKISYGIYMYHPLAVIIALKVLLIFDIDDIFSQYTFSTILTISIASISYIFYESYFINKKKTFSKIISGDNVRAKE